MKTSFTRFSQCSIYCLWLCRGSLTTSTCTVPWRETTLSRSQWPCCGRRMTWSLGHWDRGFESRSRYGCFSSSFCVVLSCGGRDRASVWSSIQGKSKKLSHSTPMEAQGGRGCIAPTHSRPRHRWGEWSASRPGLALPLGKEPPIPIIQEAGWVPEPVWTQRLEEKSFPLCRGSNLDRRVVQSAARHPSPSSPAKCRTDSKISELILNRKR
jgi:hypothetical protein